MHKALNLTDKKPIVFTALSKKYFYMRYFICAYCINQGYVPINPFTSFDYFLADLVERDLIRNANNNLVRLADELWVFGTISDGVAAEIIQVKSNKKPIKYFRILKDKLIEEIEVENTEFEKDGEKFREQILE